MKRKEETIEEYDKRIWGNLKFIAGVLLFIGFQVWLVSFLDIAV
jgi:hypothetical protein